MNSLAPLASPDFAKDRVAQRNAFQQLCTHNSEERTKVIAFFTEVFTQLMHQKEPDPKHWQTVKNTISLFEAKTPSEGRNEKWSDLSYNSKGWLFTCFIPALVMAAGIAHVNPTDTLYARYYYGVDNLQPHPLWGPRKIAPRLLEALSTPQAMKHELHEIFYDALSDDLVQQGPIIEIDGAVPLNRDQLFYVTNTTSSRPPLDTLTKTITIDGITYPLACLLGRSSRAQGTYACNRSIESVATLFQKLLPDVVLRTIVLNYSALSYVDFNAYMQTQVPVGALNALRPLCVKLSKAISTIGGAEVARDDLMARFLRHWLKSDPTYWNVTVNDTLITLSCTDAEKATDTFIQIMKQAPNFTFELQIDLPKLPEAVRAQVTSDLPITRLYLRKKDNSCRIDEEVDPLVALLPRLKQVHVGSVVRGLESLQEAPRLKSLKISWLGAAKSRTHRLPPVLETFDVYLSGNGTTEAKQTFKFPPTLKTLTLSTLDPIKFDLSSLPVGIKEVDIHCPSVSVATLVPRLSALCNLTKLTVILNPCTAHRPLTLEQCDQHEPLRILEKTPLLEELWLKGVVTLDDLGASRHNHVRKITFLPYPTEAYPAVGWLPALQKIGSLNEFCTIGPYGPDYGMQGNMAKKELFALAQAALSQKVPFTINSKKPEFLVTDLKTTMYWY